MSKPIFMLGTSFLLRFTKNLSSSTTLLQKYLVRRSITDFIVAFSDYQANKEKVIGTTVSPDLTLIMEPAVKDTVDLFVENLDRFHCIVLDLRQGKHACRNEDFDSRITASLSEWKKTGARAISVFIPIDQSHRIPIMINLGFDFHHAKPGYVLMLKWLSDTDTNNFPAYANHFLGVAGFVVNDKKQILTIKEKFTDGQPRWKLPGGGADPGEDLAITARREVFEETGIDSEFLGVICMRHLHGFRYDHCSDFYYVCLMKALTHEIKICDQELVECEWMDLEYFAKQDLHPTNKFIYECYLKAQSSGFLLVPHAIPKPNNRGQQLIYLPERITEQF